MQVNVDLDLTPMYSILISIALNSLIGVTQLRVSKCHSY